MNKRNLCKTCVQTSPACYGMVSDVPIRRSIVTGYIYHCEYHTTIYDQMFKKFMKANRVYIGHYVSSPLTYRQMMYKCILVNMNEYYWPDYWR